MSWGEPGKGKWITVYTNPGHAYIVIAGLRLDTSTGDRAHLRRDALRQRPALAQVQPLAARLHRAPPRRLLARARCGACLPASPVGRRSLAG